MGNFLSLLRHSNSPFKQCFSRRRSTDTPIFFEGSVRRQNFALPDPIIDYIAKNASNAAVFRNLVYSCKYFFIKNPKVAIPCLHKTKDGWSTCLFDKKGFEKFDMEKIPAKLLWLAVKCGKKCTPPEDADGPSPTSSIKMWIPKFYRVDGTALSLKNSILTFEEFVSFASPNLKKLSLQNCIIQYENGAPVQLESLIAQFPLLVNFTYYCRPDGSDISANTVKELLSNPNFSNMQSFYLLEIRDTFDIESLFEYLKNRDDFYCCLRFRANISADYWERLQIIIDEFLSTESTSYRFPFIVIPNMNPNTYYAIKKRFEEDCARRNLNANISDL